MIRKEQLKVYLNEKIMSFNEKIIKAI